MGIFAKYPYTDFNNLNLDWIIGRLREVENELQQYLDNAVIKFADPITWDITEQYTALTVVVDSDGTAYLSKQPVPAGVDVSNTDYWLPIFNYDDNINTLRSQIAYNAQNSPTTGQALSTDDLVFWKGEIYIVTTDMPAGTAFIVGSNITKYTVDEKFGMFGNRIDTLETNVTNLLASNDILVNSEPLNVLLLGVKNDGSEDCSSIVNSYSNDYDLYFPDGIYLVNTPLELHHSIIGASAPRMGGRGSVLKCGFNTSDYVVNYYDGTDGIGVEIRNIAIDCNAVAGGIQYAPGPGSWRPPVKITNVSVWDTAIHGIDISPYAYVSRTAWLTNCSVTGGIDGGVGYYFSANAADCMMLQCTAMYIQKCLENHGGGLSVIGGHFFTGRAGIGDIDTYWNGTITIESYANIMATNLYVDTALQFWVQRSGTATIGNLFTWNDGYYVTLGASNTSVTVLRADHGAHIKVSNLQYGGRTDINVLYGAEVEVQNCAIHGANPPFDTHIVPPLVYGMKTSYKRWIGGNLLYNVVAAIYHPQNDMTVLMRFGRNQFATDITFKKASGTITLSRTAIAGFTQPGMYYKTVGDTTYIYTGNYTYYALVELLYSTMGGGGLHQEGGLLDLSALVDWGGIGQADTSGLTTIT